MSGGGEDDPLMARLRALPGAPLPAAARVRALARAEAELARRSRGGSWSWLRWLGTEALVPTVLVMAGLLYAGGALRGLARVYGPRPAARMAAAVVVPESRPALVAIVPRFRSCGLVSRDAGRGQWPPSKRLRASLEVRRAANNGQH